jgi:serine/threonine protein kinase
VKSANVLLSEDGRVLLADFGIATLAEAASALAAAGSVIGTAAYLAPEQLRGGPFGLALDVYSLGLVLIEALTGQQAYPGAGIETAAARLHRPPAIPDDVPEALTAVLTRMTALHPVDRPALQEVASVLRPLSSGDEAVFASGDAAPTVLLPSGRATSPNPSAGRGHQGPAGAGCARPRSSATRGRRWAALPQDQPGSAGPA